VGDPYDGREQTKVKHFILKRYLQALAFKTLPYFNLAYIDGFSGPWESKSESFEDSSFMIAIRVLLDAQRRVYEKRNKERRVQCFFSETDSTAFAQLQAAVARFHRPEQGFEVRTFHGKFEDAAAEIKTYVGSSFPLIFIDPTGWTGYPFDKIKPLLTRGKCEVLINFMYDFINRFAHSEDETIIASLNPILGVPGWLNRLDPALPRGVAVERLFRQTLKDVGQFEYVVSTRIDKPAADRPHFFITYATSHPEGLKTFRQTEYAALKEQVKYRASARERRREESFHIVDMFSARHDNLGETSIDQLVDEQKSLAQQNLMDSLSGQPERSFDEVVTSLLETFMLRETDVKDLCVALARAGQIENTWGGRGRKPKGDDKIKLTRRNET
jgi:three-Cys-motif partner protein